MNTYCANLNMQHIAELSAKEIYSGLRHFYTLFLILRIPFFKWTGKKKELQVQC